MEDPRDEYYDKQLQRMDGKLAGLERDSCLVLLGLLHTHDCVDAAMLENLQTFGLSSSAFNLLSILEKQENQCLPLHEVGRLMVTSRANITGLMDSLCKRGYVERAPHPSDRRTKLARLLPEGQRILDLAWPGQARLIHHLASGLSAADRKLLITLLSRLRQQALAGAPSSV